MNLSSLGNGDPALRDSKIVFSSKANKYSGIFAVILLFSICCRKQKSTMSPLRKQGSKAKKLDSRFRGNDKYYFRNKYYLSIFLYKKS